MTSLGHRVPVALVGAAVVAWYVVSLVLFVRALDTMSLSDAGLTSLRLVTWIFGGVALLVNVSWAIGHCMQTRQDRLSDGEWRSDVVLRLALAMAVLSVVVVTLFVDADSDLFEIDVADRLLFTPLSAFEALLCPLILAPLFVVLVLFAAIGRARGNAIKRRSL